MQVVQRGEKFHLIADLVSRDGMSKGSSGFDIQFSSLGHHAAKKGDVEGVGSFEIVTQQVRDFLGLLLGVFLGDHRFRNETLCREGLGDSRRLPGT